MGHPVADIVVLKSATVLCPPRPPAAAPHPAPLRLPTTRPSTRKHTVWLTRSRSLPCGRPRSLADSLSPGRDMTSEVGMAKAISADVNIYRVTDDWHGGNLDQHFEIAAAMWEAEVPCSENTAKCPCSSRTLSPRKTTRPLYEWNSLASSLCLT